MPIRRALLAATLLLPTMAAAQPTAPADPTAASLAETGTGEPAHIVFNQQLSEWKALLKELHAVRIRFLHSDPSKGAALRERWDELAAEGNAMLPKLRASGLAAYLSFPEATQGLTEFLGRLSIDDLDHDDYEALSRLAFPMIDGGCSEFAIFLAGGIAAAALNDYDRLERIFPKYQNELVKRGEGAPLRDDAEHILPTLYNVREEYRKLWEEEKALREKEEAQKLPRVLLRTNRGDIELLLFQNEAPNTVANFVTLAEKGFYDGLLFHRVLPNFMAQTGCPEGTGEGGPGYTIPCECYRPEHRNHFRGSLSMAIGAGRNTGGSQFFITFLPTPHLNGRHTVFGRVVKGIEVLRDIHRVDPEKQAQPTPDRILEAKVLYKDPDKSYDVEKIPR